MLLHQFILVAVAAIKRFEALLLGIPGALRRWLSRRKISGSDVQET